MDRTDQLRNLGVSVGASVAHQDLGSHFSPYLLEPSLTSYSEFTRISVRSKTIRTDNADVESHQRRDREVGKSNRA